MEKSRRIYEPLRLLKDRDWGRELLAPLAKGNRNNFDDFHKACSKTELLKDIPENDDAMALGDMAMMMTHMRYSTQGDAEATAAIGFKEKINATAVASMILAGRHIVHFDEDITDALSRSESAGLTVDDLNLPWDSFYVAFEGDSFIEDGFRLDGMIVHKRDGEALLVDPLIAENPVTSSHGIWQFPLKFGTGKDLLKDIQSQLLELDEEYVTKDSPLKRLMQKHIPVFVNALLYLSAEPDAGEVRWQDGAPAKLVIKASAEGRQAQKAEQELHYSQWNRVRYVGSHKDTHRSANENAPAAHWVRGHFRKQAHGKGRLERKIIWIRPHLSGGSATDIGEHADVRLIDSKN